MPRRKAENRTIEVILLQQEKHLGEKFELIKVKPVFARNILLPQNIVVLATKDNTNKYKQKIASAEKEREKKASSIKDLIKKIEEDGKVVISKKANKENVLYAKVHEEEISNIIKEKYGMTIDSHYIKLKKKIETTGDYIIPFSFKEVSGEIKLSVIKEEEKEDKKENREDKEEKNNK